MLSTFIRRFTTLLLPLLLLPFASAQYGPLRNPPPLPSPEQWQERMDRSVRELKANHLAEAVALAEEAIRMAPGFGPHDTRLSRSQVLRAEIYLWEKDYERARAQFEAAIASAERAVGPKHPELVHPLSSLANFYYYVQPKHDQVAALFERILDIVEHAPHRSEADVIMWSRNLGTIYQQLGQFERAEPLFARTIALAEKSEPQWASHEYLSSAEFYLAWKKFDRAEALARHALEQREAALAAAPDNIDAKLDVAVALDALGAIHTAAGQLALAEKDCRRSLTIIETFMAPDQPDLRPRFSALAHVLREEGKLDESAAVYQRLLTLTEKNFGGESAELATVLTDYATVLQKQQKTKEAVALEEKAAAIRKRTTASL